MFSVYLNMKHGIRLSCLTSCVMIALAARGDAWNSGAHRKIVSAAVDVSSAPGDLRQFLTEHRRLLEEFSAIPDIKDADCASHDPAACRAKANELIQRILAGKRSKVIAQNFGRLSHYIADLNHPILSGGLNEGDGKNYNRYEGENPGRDGIDFWQGLIPARHVEDFEDWMAALARNSNRGQGASSNQGAPDPDAVQSQISASVQAVADLWYTLWRLKESESVRDDAFKNPNEENFLKLAGIYAKQGREDKVRKTFQWAASKLGESEKVILAEVHYDFDRKNFENAARLCEKMLKKKPGSLTFRYQRAVIRDHWYSSGDLSGPEGREKAIEFWNDLIGTQFGEIARQRINKLRQ